jgi:ketosteroid isomerase-like protein
MEETILTLENGAMERWRNGDPWGWLEISAESMIYVDPSLTRPIIGLEAFGALLKEIEGKVHYQGSEFIDPKVVIIGDAAVLSYNYRSSALTPEGTILSQTPWNTTEVYFHLDGEWKIVHSHWSYVQNNRPEIVEVPVPVPLSPEGYAGTLGELMALESAAMERWRKGDSGGFIEICAPEVTYFDSGTPKRINGREALKAEYARIEGKVAFEVMDFISPEVRVCGDLAVLVYRFMSTRLNPDGSVSKRTPWNCTEVFIRSDDHWRIIHTHWSYIQGERT